MYNKILQLWRKYQTKHIFIYVYNVNIYLSFYVRLLLLFENNKNKKKKTLKKGTFIVNGNYYEWK